MNKRMKKLLKNLGVVLAITTITATSVLANESENKQIFSTWAVKELNDAISYGLINGQVIQEDMRCPISELKYMELCENVVKKIEEIPGTTKKEELTITMPESGEVTKQDMLEMLHTILTNYEYSTDLGIDIDNIVSCMKELEVVRGDGKNEGLENTCTVEQAVVMSRRFVESIYDLCDADSEGLFWKVESNGNTVYLVGSIHIGKAGMYPIRDEIMEAYESADEFYGEIDFFGQESAEAQAMKVYNDGTTVKDYLSEEYYEKLTQILKEYNITPEDLGNSKDWDITLALPYLAVQGAEESEDLSENDTIGVDYLFAYHALQDHKPIKALETFEEHWGAFDIHMSQEVKTYKLESAIDEMLELDEQAEENQDLMVEAINDMQEEWKEGDTETLKDIFIVSVNEETKKLPEDKQKLEEEYNKALVDDRDQIMADSIDEALQSKEGKTYFIIAGLAHFISDTGVLTRLEEKGYKIERIK